MKIPSVSVILPCYNAAQTLEETLESIEGQTHKDFEVIAVDDGSTDRTADILDHWSKRDSRFKCIFQPHAGVISASNAGMLASVSPYIARLDADDRAHPQRLEKQIAFLDENPDTALVGCLVKAFPEEDVGDGFRIYIEWLNALVSDDDIRREFFIESPLPNPSVMIRREWMLRMGGYQDHGWPEDYDLFLRLYLAGARFAKIPEVLHEWRDHPNRITHTDSRYSLENFLRTKAYYLARGPLKGRDAVIVWGSGMMGRRLAKQLERQDMPLVAFVDIDPKKIGRTRRGKPIIAPDELEKCWGQYQNPVILASVGSRGARKLIRQRLNNFGYKEGIDWWAAA
ncbi:MAG: glycosyltransferase [Anaerolineae bacterium]|nr:glycosyltransferase [Anaerolineae bacterium]